MEKKLYLSHPFPTRRRMREWELKIEKRLGIEIVNPFYDTNRTDVAKIDAGVMKRYAIDCKVIVERDLNEIKKSDGLIVYIDGSLSYGTPMEMVYAKLEGKPIYTVVSNGHEDHPWIKYHSTEIFTSLQGLEKWLKKNQNSKTSSASTKPREMKEKVRPTKALLPTKKVENRVPLMVG